MSSLYRKYRPQTFSDVLGQDHICSSLTSALKNDKVGHAYLFSGPRGTGKTTLARLFARAVNCQKRSLDQNPCNQCELCVEIADGRSMDILEIDAASNRGIDEIRELRDKIGFAPNRAKFKVYIIDEVHMLTKEAFNALLKTLEEPPSHAIFVLATTELHKVPETIISRCQRYAFHRASSEALVSLLTKIAAYESIKIDEAGLKALADRSEGSYRDSLTLMGNLATCEESLTSDMVRHLLGLPPTELVEELLVSLIEGQTDKLTTLLKQFLDDGGDLMILVKGLADRCKQELLTGSENRPATQTATLLEQLLSVHSRSRVSADPTALVLAQLLSLSMQHTAPSVPVAVTTQTVVAEPKPVEVKAMVDVQKVEKKSEEPSVDGVLPTVSKAPVQTSDSTTFWGQFLEGIKNHNHALYMVIRSAQLEGLTEEEVTIAVKFRFYVDRLNELRNKKIIENVASQVSGRQLRLNCVIRADLDVGLPTDDDLMRTVVDVFELEEAKS